MKFTKMHGLGNDYLYIYGAPKNPKELSVKLSDRHFGIGSDGIILISPSDIADFKMRIFNADGSEAKMCGNGIRCVGKYVYDKGYTDKKILKIETLSGIRTLKLHIRGGKTESVTADMGKITFSDDISLNAGGKLLTLTPVSVGNPHAVAFTEDAESVPLSQLGPEIERSDFFPGGVNAEFVEVKAANRLRMRVWERGSGITMACGTGACASAAAAVYKKICPFNEEISVILDGGTLKINVSEDYSVKMTGPAEFICEGESLT